MRFVNACADVLAQFAGCKLIRACVRYCHVYRRDQVAEWMSVTRQNKELEGNKFRRTHIVIRWRQRHCSVHRLQNILRKHIMHNFVPIGNHIRICGNCGSRIYRTVDPPLRNNDVIIICREAKTQPSHFLKRKLYKDIYGSILARRQDQDYRNTIAIVCALDRILCSVIWFGHKPHAHVALGTNQIAWSCDVIFG